MSLISDALKRVAEQRAGRKQPPTVPRMLAGRGPQQKRRQYIVLGLTILLAGVLIGVVVYSLLQGKAGETSPSEAVTPTPQQVIFEKIPPPSKPVKTTADSERSPLHVAKSEQRSPEKPKVLRAAIQKQPIRVEKVGQPTAPPSEDNEAEQPAAAAKTLGVEVAVGTVEQPRQPANAIHVGQVSLESAEEVMGKQEPVRVAKAPQGTVPPPDNHKTAQIVTGAKTDRPEPARTTGAQTRRPSASQKVGQVDLQAESTAGAALLYRKAVSFQKEMRWQKAIETYQRLLKLEPMSAEVYNNLGVCYEKKGELKMAATSFEKAISINPRFYPSYNNLGIIYYRLKNFDKARAAYEQALQLNPGNSQSEINLALVYERLRRRQLAQRTLERVLANDPENVEAHYNLGRILEDQGKPEAALGHYRQFLAANPSAYPQLREKVENKVRSLQSASNK